MTTSSKRPTTSSFSPTALISLSRIFFLSSGMVMHITLKLPLMSLKRPLMLSLDLLLVLWDGDAHNLEVAVDVAEETVDVVLGFVENVLPLSEIVLGCFQIEMLLNFLDLLFSLVKACGNSFIIFSVSHPGVLCFSEQLQPFLSLVLGVIPANFNSLDMSLQELWFVWVFKDLLALLNQVLNNIPLCVELDKRLLLPLNELINILHTGGSNVTGGREHDAVEELNMGLQLITVGVALPVQINHDRGLLNAGNELLVLLDEHIQLLILGLLL